MNQVQRYCLQVSSIRKETMLPVDDTETWYFYEFPVKCSNFKPLQLHCRQKRQTFLPCTLILAPIWNHTVVSIDGVSMGTPPSTPYRDEGTMYKGKGQKSPQTTTKPLSMGGSSYIKKSNNSPSRSGKHHGHIRTYR